MKSLKNDKFCRESKHVFKIIYLFNAMIEVVIDIFYRNCIGFQCT